MNFLFAWRYFKAKKTTNAINVISWISIIAISLTTAALVIGDRALKQRKKSKFIYDLGSAWKEMAGLRDKLIHDYTGVDYPLVWKICKESIPELDFQIEEIIKEKE